MNYKQLFQHRSFYILLAFFVTILWSSSWLLIKFGLEKENLPPLTFAGIRYVLAATILVLVVLCSSQNRSAIKNLPLNWWGKLAGYGIIFFTLTQGAQYLGLLYLPAITVSLLLSFTPIITMILGILLIKERPNALQLFFILLALAGTLVYFIPLMDINYSTTTLIGLLVVGFGVVTNSVSAILGRRINKSQTVSPLIVTAISMLIGSIVLLITGLIIEGIPTISITAIVYILLLSIVNTAIAFTLWNRAMQKLRALEITIINNTMLIQITFLAVIFLGERPKPLEWVGLAILGISALLVQILRTKPKKEEVMNVNN
ncbi:MAG: EamA family transporter [Candidatus Heimdallarchaeota archaeon]|nr:EamA family transporter [Candidatus Heimdallarchaeota archaeon]